MPEIKFIPLAEIQKIQTQTMDKYSKARILSDIFRINTVSMIMEAGSGHLGTSLSCLDILTWLWANELKGPNSGNPDADVFFSSKGHDVPALYSVLAAHGIIEYGLMHKLRKLNGLPGHPDVKTPGIAANTGSLGMGISKARGMAIAKRLNKNQGRIFVLTGDGELQEGQIWESLGQAAHGNFSEITVIVDHNKIQSDTWVKETNDLGDLEAKFKSFGWDVARCDGHDFAAIESALEGFKQVTDKPHILIADTIKGKGVSQMEKISQEGEFEFYKFHSGAPSSEVYTTAIAEIATRLNQELAKNNITEISFESVSIPEKTVAQNPQRLVTAYGSELANLGQENPELVVLDADLMLDCGLLEFRKKFPQRYFECGIAEQDMVSMAGGLALAGKLPIVHSFACFLTTRPNEQIYNNASEGKKIIYAGSLAGLLPALPGHSHQSVRDISILGSIPGLTLIQPGDEVQTRQALRWAVKENPESTYIRLISVPCEMPCTLPESNLVVGQGSIVRQGKDALLFSYGPVILTQAFKAAELLKEQGIEIAVCNLPWLNRIDEQWLLETVKNYGVVFTLDDHYLRLGQGDQILAALSRQGYKGRTHSFGLTKLPVCGRAEEALQSHGLDPAGLAGQIKAFLPK